MDWLSDLWAKIKEFIKEFWPVILIAICLFWPPATAFLANAWAWLGAAVETYGLFEVLAMGFGLLAVVAPEEASRIAENLGDVAGSVGSALGEAAGSTLGAFLGSPGGLIITGVILFAVLGGKGDNGSSNKLESKREEPRGALNVP